MHPEASERPLGLPLAGLGGSNHLRRIGGEILVALSYPRWEHWTVRGGMAQPRTGIATRRSKRDCARPVRLRHRHRQRDLPPLKINVFDSKCDGLVCTHASLIE